VSAGHDGDALATELAGICADYPDASWEVLAQLDQFHRRGQIPPAIFRSVKTKTETLIFGPEAADQTPELRISSAKQEPRHEPQPAGVIPSRSLRPGSVLRDRYELEAPLGRGGIATTFKALDRHRLELPFADRYVAVKVLRDEFSARPEAIVALQDEFGVAQSLSHPNIINVFDLDRDGDLHFITMELVQGESLQALMELTRPDVLPRGQAFTIIREAGAALEYAHERGVVHGDLKPSNIMVPTLGGVRVLDFGLSNRGASDPVSANPARALTVQMATPGYASPERRMGLQPDPRDDLFSLACIAYELLCGQRPYGGDWIDPAHPGADRPRRIRALKRRRWRALQQGLALTRDRRQRTVREFLEGLDLQTATGGVQAQRGLQQGSGRRFWPMLVLALSLAVGALGFLTFADTTPFRDQPWAVATRNFTEDAVARVTRWYQATYQSIRERLQQPAPQVAPGVVTGSEGDAIEEISPPPAIDAITEPVGEEPAKAPPASAASVPVAGGPGVLAFAQDSFTIGEGETVARLMVRRQSGTDGEVSFRWRTEGASARADEDFVPFADTTEPLAAGQTAAVIYVPIVSDAVKEFTEHFVVEIRDAQSGASLGRITRATVIIVDDD
jgi:hypothetical protein